MFLSNTTNDGIGRIHYSYDFHDNTSSSRHREDNVQRFWLKHHFWFEQLFEILSRELILLFYTDL